MGSGNMKEIRRRIKSVESTMQITKAMELVASSKLRKAKERALKIRPFFESLYEVMTDIVENNRDFSCVYTSKREVKNSLYIVIAGDRGLAGGFNSNLFKFAKKEMQGKNCIIIPIGKKSCEFFSRQKANVVAEFSNIGELVSVNQAGDIAKIVVDIYKNEEIDEVFVAYTMFISPLNQQPQILDILPLTLDSYKENISKSKELMIYEPSIEVVFENIVPQYITGIILGAIIESYAAEQGARRIAMESATDNGKEVLDTLSLNYNRARQSAITQEIAEIVSGANAAK